MGREIPDPWRTTSSQTAPTPARHGQPTITARLRRAALRWWPKAFFVVVQLNFARTLIIGIQVAAVLAWHGDRQCKEADGRAEWWRRTQWAMDYATDAEGRKASVGVEALDLLGESPLATEEDRHLLKTLFEQVVAVAVLQRYGRATLTGPRPEALCLRSDPDASHA